MTPEEMANPENQINENDDRRALDRIQYMLRDPEWGVGMLEDIAGILVESGREMGDILDEDGDPISTWGRH